MCVLVKTECEEADHALVTAESGLKLAYYLGVGIEFDKCVKTGRFLLDGIGQLAETPHLGVHDGGAVVGEHLRKLFYASFICSSDKTGVKMKTVS